MLLSFARCIRSFVRQLPSPFIMIKTGLFGALGIVLQWQGWSVLTTVLLLLIIYSLTGGWNYLKVACITFPRDLRALYILIYLKWHMKKYTKANSTIANLFAETARRYKNKVAIKLVDGNQMTFRELDEYSNRVANYLSSVGYKQGDSCSIVMDGCPEYLGLWLGMSKIGVVPALINYNLRGESLARCIMDSKSTCVVYSDNFASVISEIKPKFSAGVNLYCIGNYDASVLKAVHLNPLLADASSLPPPVLPNTKFTERLYYVYTSGTTGFPKAAVISHSRFYYMASSAHMFFNLNTEDIIYNVLPLYHTAGGTLGLGQAVLYGNTIVIRKKFSASKFWQDCVNHNCTVAQYIGELCRYLLAQPNNPADRQHRVHTAFGNGLRSEIWVKFQERFGVARIGEFYGSTEGNANIMNITNTVGCVGFTSRILPNYYPITLIRVDESNQPLRDATGMCIRCQPGEQGELVGKIVKSDPMRAFDGYTNKAETEKKIARDVFTRGDYAFRTGDLLLMDELGNFFFKDRTGDTFRWRGENVSTAEVEATVSSIVKLNDATVYGVEIPGIEGRAGMAAIVDPNHTVELDALNAGLQKTLPAYAKPVFIRLMDDLESTATFKLKKGKLRDEAFNPNKVTDKMFYMDNKKSSYQPITADVYKAIIDGTIRI